VKITGHLAKSPSFWIKRVDFVRDYQKIDGFWLLSREEAVSGVRIYGKETLTIDYQDYAVNGVGAVRALLTSGQPEQYGDRGSSEMLWPMRLTSKCVLPMLFETSRTAISVASTNELLRCLDETTTIG